MTAEHILIVQTAFLGDVVLTLPLVQTAKELFPSASIGIVVVPGAAELLTGHPAISNVIPYDKYGADGGVSGFAKLTKTLRKSNYTLALIPHRSLRSALLVFFAGIPVRIGFDRSAGRWFFTGTVHYDPIAHEVERNLSLLGGVVQDFPRRVLPKLYPSKQSSEKIDGFLAELKLSASDQLIAIAPGTIWNTKRWLKERFAELAGRLAQDSFKILLVGGKGDERLCQEIVALNDGRNVYRAAGRLSVIESAELIRRCRVLISNDSAPMHVAIAVGTPVVAIFGATIPGFGFAPIGKHDIVIETNGLNCRPCSIHGGEECPIKTFECMKAITSERVYERVNDVLRESR